jgi:hypothetical protein
LLVDRGWRDPEHRCDIPSFQHASRPGGHVGAKHRRLLARAPHRFEVSCGPRRNVAPRDAEGVPWVRFAADNISQRLVTRGRDGLGNGLGQHVNRSSAQRVTGGDMSA